MMKIQTISAVLAAVAIPLATTSCDYKEKDSSASAETESPTEKLNTPAEELTYSSHAEVIEGLEGVMEEMMLSMAAIKDVESAEAYAETLQGIKSKMKALHASAIKLDSPTPEDIAAYEATTEAVQKKHGPVIMAKVMGMQSNPDAQKITEIMEGAKDDDEMDKIGDELGLIYTAKATKPEAAE